eukprot:2419223-Rhodomonas_salina.1
MMMMMMMMMRERAHWSDTFVCGWRERLDTFGSRSSLDDVCCARAARGAAAAAAHRPRDQGRLLPTLLSSAIRIRYCICRTYLLTASAQQYRQKHSLSALAMRIWLRVTQR